MNVLVDTCVWSLALRKRALSSGDMEIVQELKDLIQKSRVLIIGAIRQELLSGISDDGIFYRLREKLSAFEDSIPSRHTYEKAAEFSNLCRKEGIQGSHTDFLICSVAFENSAAIFTTDKDFEGFCGILPITLHSIR
jgi:predicted nucleic acid-binding protein